MTPVGLRRWWPSTASYWVGDLVGHDVAELLLELTLAQT